MWWGFFFFAIRLWAVEPDWSTTALLPIDGRWNPYELSEADFLKNRKQGQIHAHLYPVETTGILIPEKPIRKILDNTAWNPLTIILNEIFKGIAGINSFEGLFLWAGLVPPPATNSPEIFQVALPDNFQKGDLYGFSRIQKDGVSTFTMSCAACHSDQLFGQTVLGMSKRFPRANEFFLRAQKASSFYDSFLVQLYTGASDQEMTLLDEAFENLLSVGLKQPLVLGLDTSLAQVALSLNKRAPTPWADKDDEAEIHPHPDVLDHQPGDSKPAVWWNTKYKTRWLSDGSVISGNPIYTNLLWNEIGRGSNLHELDQWFQRNTEVVQELTTAVFSTPAPRFEDFFPAELIDRQAALRGEQIFNRTCMRCHGRYEKNWSLADDSMPWRDQIKNLRVVYPQPTRVYDVGTDSYRRVSMKSLEKLNSLQISKNQGIVVQSQEGYVPPPLESIWARWPYFHNNAIPHLCALLTRAQDRPKSYYAGPPTDPENDYDQDCAGYPTGTRTPREWTSDDEFKYNTHKKGLSNAGHDEGIFLENGKELLSPQDKKDLIVFLKTL